MQKHPAQKKRWRRCFGYDKTLVEQKKLKVLQTFGFFFLWLTFFVLLWYNRVCMSIMGCKDKMEGYSSMSKKKGEGLKSFNKGFSVPDTYIIIFFVVVLAAIVTFFVPKGYYETQDVTYMMNGVEKTRTVIKDGSFQYLTDDAGKAVTEGVTLFSGDGESGFFNYMFNGIVSDSAIQIIAFLLVVGGAFGIMIRTGAIEAGLVGLIRKAKGAEKLLIPVLFVLFSLGGAVFGMGEEALPFTMILCPLFVAVGYDTVIAVLVTYVATQIGFGASWMNPFSVGIAQGIAGIDVFSGAGFRMVMWVVFTALGCGMTMFYAAKVKKTPTISVAYESDAPEQLPTVQPCCQSCPDVSIPSAILPPGTACAGTVGRRPTWTGEFILGSALNRIIRRY